jgi:ferritin
MLNAKVEKAINEQILAETYSAYLYLSMAAYFESKGLRGMASWMKCQAQEELTHAMKFFNFVGERGGRVVLGAIEAPPGEWESPLAVFESALGHERKVTALINDLVDLAIAEKDHASRSLLEWFVDEQVEEEATAGGIVDQLKLIGEGGQGLLMLDRELGARSFAYPPPALGGGE